MVARRCAWFVLLVMVFGGAGCATDDGSGGATPTEETAGGDAAEPAFCAAWSAAVASGDDSAIEAVLADAPAAVADAAAVVLAAGSVPTESEQAAGAEIVDWTQVHCQRGRPGDNQRVVAPPIDTQVGGLTFCAVTGSFPALADDGSGLVLYGDIAADDPYDGPMLGLMWNNVDDGGHRGDGDSALVTVRGEQGVAAPITVFQQVVLPELGTVVAWSEGDQAFGLYGRGWSMDRIDELVAIADRVEELDGRFGIPADRLPAGFGEVFSGSPAALALVVTPWSLYSLRYESADGGVVDVSGFNMTEEEFEAFRFFTVGVNEAQVAGRDALAGNAWNDDEPAVVTWREPDGLVLRIVGLGVPLTTAHHLAENARQLTAAEWAALVEAEDRC